MIALFLPSPSQGVWHLGVLPIRAYAFCIILGVLAGIWLTERRWVAGGGTPGVVTEIATWVIPFGIVGARLYHVLTNPELYFVAGRDPWGALYIWQGGLGIWGGVAFGAVGAWIGCRRQGIPLADFADAVAPGVALGQAIGRWGNWFNQELFGKPTTLPWGLEIDPNHRPDGYAEFYTFHPTFLYESLWDFGVVAFVLWCGYRFGLANGRLFAVYVMAYTTGRVWIEALRIDTANDILGVRLNVWTSVLIFAGAAVYFVVRGRRPSLTQEPVASG